MMTTDPAHANGKLETAGGYGPPGGGWGPPGGGYGPPGAPPGAPPGGGYGPPGGAPPPPAGGFGGGGPGGFGPPGGFPPPGGPMMPGAGGDVNTTLPLILNIVGLVLCSGTCVGAILCIVGIVFAVQGNNLKSTGDLDSARKKAKTSMTMFVIAAALGTVGYVILGILQAMAPS